MIDLVDLLRNLSFRIAPFLLQSTLLVLRVESMCAATGSAAASPTPASPPLPWKRFADAPVLATKRPKETTDRWTPRRADDGLVAGLRGRQVASPGVTGWRTDKGCSVPGREDDRREKNSAVQTLHGAGGEAGGRARVRRRPMKIVIPASDVSSELGADAGKAESSGEFQEGSCYAVASKRGKRRVMEDDHAVITGIKGDARQAYFGVFDGHGGRAAVDYASEKLGENILAALAEHEHAETAIREGYMTTDKEFLSLCVGSGACAATVLLKDGEVHAANAGDCRVVISRKGVAAALTADHRPARDDERVRIQRSGGYVSCHGGVWRAQGSLAVSRAIGDLHVKDWIISEPETTKLRLTPDSEFLIMASDGLWDQVSNQEAVDAVTTTGKNLLQSCKKLVDMASGRGGPDDITVMVVDLQRFVRAD